MAEHENVARIREAAEAFLNGDIGPWEILLAENVVWHEIGGRTIHGKDAVVALTPDDDSISLSGEVHDVVGNDQHVVALMSVTVGAGERHFSYRTAEVYHMSAGQITERWAMAEDTRAITEFFSTLG